jgi:hypothetical protein
MYGWSEGLMSPSSATSYVKTTDAEEGFGGQGTSESRKSKAKRE